MSANPRVKRLTAHSRKSARRFRSELARTAPASQRARQNQRNREISTVLHMSGRAPVCEKWRSIGDWRARRRLDAAAFHRRKVWQNGGLRSNAVRSEHGEMALWTLEKAPFCAIFHPFFDDFRRVFLHARPSGRKLARMRPRKALVLKHSQSRTCALRSGTSYHSLPMQGGDQPGPRAENRERGQNEAR